MAAVAQLHPRARRKRRRGARAAQSVATGLAREDGVVDDGLVDLDAAGRGAGRGGGGAGRGGVVVGEAVRSALRLEDADGADGPAAEVVELGQAPPGGGEVCGGEAEGDEGGGELLVVAGAVLEVEVEDDGEERDEGDEEVEEAVAAGVVDGLPRGADEVQGLQRGPREEDEQVEQEDDVGAVAERHVVVHGWRGGCAGGRGVAARTGGGGCGRR